MREPEAKGQRLIALFILGCLLFNYPVLSLFNVAAEAFGVPVLLVALMAVVVESRR